MDVIFQEADFSFSSSTTNHVSVYSHLNPIVLDDELFSGRNHDVHFDKSIEDGGNFDLAWAHLQDLTLETAFTPPPVSVPRKSAKSF